MTEVAHTPGPYERRYTHGVGWSLHVPHDFDGKVPGATLRVASSIGNERDACLRQAAPDMLATLECISGEASGQHAAPEQTLKVIREYARAAISKALGAA